MPTPAQLARMDVAVAPYPPLENFYFSPLKVYEYLAAGLPVVASDVGPLPGLLVPPCGDPAGAVYPAGSILHLADAVSRLRHAPAARADLSRHGRQAMVQRHDWRRVLEHVLELSEVDRVKTQAT